MIRLQYGASLSLLIYLLGLTIVFSADGLFSKRDLNRDYKKITIVDKDGQRYIQKAFIYSTGVHEKAKTIVRTDSLVECPDREGFRCYRLKRPVTNRPAGGDPATVQVVHQKPIPDILLTLDPDGKSDWKLPSDIAVAQDRLSNSMYGDENSWLSLEPADYALDGHLAITALSQLVNVKEHQDCRETCSDLYAFETEHSERGIVLCRFQQDIGVRGPPYNCEVMSLDRGGNVFVRSEVSSEPIGGSTGAGAEGFGCSIPRTAPPSQVIEAVRDMLKGPPFDLTIREGRSTTAGLAMVGLKSGGKSDILAKMGKGIYFEKLTLHGEIGINESPNDFSFGGVLSMNVNRQSEALKSVAYELGELSERYMKEALKEMQVKLSKSLGLKVSCQYEG